MRDIFARFLKEISLYGLEAVGRYYSSYRGTVFDRDDPDGRGRLQLYVPQVYGTQAYKYWAPQKGCYSGKDYGMQVIPQIGESVWVEFEYGDPRRPIWTYGHFANTQDGTPEKPEELRNPNQFWFKTPGGLGIIFDDNTGKIEFFHPGGSRVTVDEEGVRQEGGQSEINIGDVKIQVTDSGVNIDAGNKKVYINGNMSVLYHKVEGATQVSDIKEIGVSNKVRIG